MILFRILLRSKKQHMLTEVRQPVQFGLAAILRALGINQIPTTYKYAGSAFLNINILNHKASHAIIELNVSVHAIVQFALLDLV